MKPKTKSHRGSNQSGMRAYNERLVLTLIRRRGALAKSAIAQITGLSAQTVTVIVRALEGEGLLVKGDPVRGNVGQPSVPMLLNPGGAYFIGLKIGRRSASVVLVDFTGRIIGDLRHGYDYPTVAQTVDFALSACEELARMLPEDARGRIAGLGIAMPYRMWEWPDFSGACQGELRDWQTRDIRAEIARSRDFPVFLENDATAACGAELLFGHPATPADFLYFYIGFFVGGGVVLNDRLITGKTGNAGALGSMPVPVKGGETVQLVEIASLSTLEARLVAAGQDAGKLWETARCWDVDAAVLERWIAATSAGLAHAIAAASAVQEFEAALIDGWLPEDVRARIVSKTRAHLARINLAGVVAPEVRAGTVGAAARALGAAAMPLSERFFVNPNAFFKAP